MFPYRKSFYSCNDEVNNGSLSSIELCDPSTKYIAYTEGLSIGASSLVTKWVRDDPRLAYEVGLEMHMDVLHAGPSWFYQTEAPDVSIVADRLNGRTMLPMKKCDHAKLHLVGPPTNWCFGWI